MPRLGTPKPRLGTPPPPPMPNLGTGPAAAHAQ